MLLPAVNNKRKLRVFAHNEKDFTTNGLGVIPDAIEPKVMRDMDGSHTLEFQLDYRSDSWDLIMHQCIVLADGQYYRIIGRNRKSDGAEVSTVKCYHVFADSRGVNIPIFPKAPKPSTTQPKPVPPEFKTDTVYNHLVSAFEGSRFHVLSPTELAELGMLYPEQLLDFESQGKVTAGDIISQVISKSEKAELYVNNWSVAVVQRVGKNKGVRISELVNAESVEESADSGDIVNVITVGGKDGLPLPTTFPNSIYRSEESIRLFGEIGGYMDFDDIEDQAELLSRISYECSPTNPERIDMPKSAITFQYIDLAKVGLNYQDIDVGDSVFVQTQFTRGKAWQELRVKTVVKYPLSPENGSITVGSPPRSLTDYIAGVILAGEKFDKVIDERGRVKASWLTNIIATKRTWLNTQLGSMPIELHRTGDVWEHPHLPFATAIIGGMMAMANKKLADGDWAWSTFITPADVTTGTANIGQLNSSIVKVADDNGYLNLFASMIEMYSRTGVVGSGQKRIRMRMGVDPIDDEFKLVLYNKDGVPVFYLDDTGQLQIRGRIESQTALTTDLYAENGYISELTVDRLQTSDFVKRYNLKDTSDVDYIEIEDQWQDFYTASAAGGTTQLVNRYGQKVYWQENPYATGNYTDAAGVIRRENGQQVLTTVGVTPFPVTVYAYNIVPKMRIGFSDGGNPYIEMGNGTGQGSNGKALLIKTSGGFQAKYTTMYGQEVGVQFSEAGISLLNGESLVTDIRTADTIPFSIEVVDSDPVDPAIGRMWMVV